MIRKEMRTQNGSVGDQQNQFLKRRTWTHARGGLCLGRIPDALDTETSTRHTDERKWQRREGRKSHSETAEVASTGMMLTSTGCESFCVGTLSEAPCLRQTGSTSTCRGPHSPFQLCSDLSLTDHYLKLKLAPKPEDLLTPILAVFLHTSLSHTTM